MSLRLQGISRRALGARQSAADAPRRVVPRRRLARPADWGLADLQPSPRQSPVEGGPSRLTSARCVPGASDRCRWTTVDITSRDHCADLVDDALLVREWGLPETASCHSPLHRFARGPVFAVRDIPEL